MTADTISLSPSVPVNGKPKAIPSSKLGTNPTSGVPASDGQNGQNGQDVDAQNVHTTNDSEKSTQTTTSGLVTDSSVLHRNLKVTLPIITHAKGSYLYTSTGRILDGSGGAAVVSVGHCVPEIVEAVSRQLSTVPYVSSALFAIAPAEELAARMCKDSGMERAIFLSGGSEAVESAIKLARQYHCERGEGGRTEFIAREGSYHGNTLGGEFFDLRETAPEATATATSGRSSSPKGVREICWGIAGWDVSLGPHSLADLDCLPCLPRGDQRDL